MGPLTITRRNGTLSKERLQEARNDPASVPAYTVFSTSVTALDAEATVVLSTYETIPHRGIWTVSDNGFYVIHLPTETVKDMEGNTHPGGR